MTQFPEGRDSMTRNRVEASADAPPLDWIRSAADEIFADYGKGFCSGEVGNIAGIIEKHVRLEERDDDLDSMWRKNELLIKTVEGLRRDLNHEVCVSDKRKEERDRAEHEREVLTERVRYLENQVKMRY